LTSKSSVAVACFLPGRAKDLSAPLYMYGVFHTIIQNPQKLSFQGPGGGERGLVRRICSLADGKRSTADIHKELKNAEGTRNEPAALTSKMLFKHVCLFASICKPVHLLPMVGISGGCVHFPSNISRKTHCFLRQSTTTINSFMTDFLLYVGMLTHDDRGVDFWVAQIRDIIMTRVC